MVSDDDFEIRRFRMRGCDDQWGARVYAAVSVDGDEKPWTVYHRPDRDVMFPVKLLHVDTFDQALELCRNLVKTYNQLDSFTSARREGAPEGGRDGDARAATGSDVAEGRAREA